MVSPDQSSLQSFPNQLLVNPTKPGQILYMDHQQGLYADATIAEAFKTIDHNYEADPEAKIRDMFDAVTGLALRGTFGQSAEAKISVMTDEDDAESDELLIVTSPLNDGPPTSTLDDVMRYLETPEPSFMQIAKARPNSVGPATKLSTGYQLRRVSGRSIPMAQIWSPVPPRAMSAEDRWKLAHGDYSAYGKIALETVDYINSIRHKEGKKPITKIGFFGAGIGQRAIGAARYVMEHGGEDLTVTSVHAMNLALRRGAKVAIDHTGQRSSDEPSQVKPPNDYSRIPESQMRQALERKTDTAHMFARQAKAIAQPLATSLPFMFASNPTIDDIEKLVSNEVPVRITNGFNVAMAVKTFGLLPVEYNQPGRDILRYTNIVAKAGEKVTMASNEHNALVAVAMNMGPLDAAELRR